ncbi:MAG: lysophospholipid acyltransferase family protein, partial [Gammaproteobacteria bacterium]
MRARLIRWLLRLCAALPLPLAHALGNFIGWWLCLIPNDLRRIGAINIPLCFPELSAPQQRRLLHASLIESGKTLTEAGALWLWPAPRLAELVQGISGEEHLRAALAAGKGAILAAPHLGAWEMMGLYSSLHYPITSLYRPPRLTELDALVRHGRERFGAKLVAVDGGGVRALYQALGRGEVVGILPDQEPGAGNGVFAPLFGVQANTMVLLSRLAIRTGAAVIFCYAERLPRGRGYHLHFLPAPPAINRTPLESSAAVVNVMLETLIRQCPAQYQ